jgi:hypothetical protein
MPKVFFTQSACVLLEGAVTLEQLTEALRAWGPKLHDAPEDHWAMGSKPAVIVATGQGGRIVVDAVPHPWPDEMGGVDKVHDDDVFAAWSLHMFEPFVWPLALARAIRHRWDEPTAAAAERHRAFVRIRHLVDPEMEPGAYDPFSELRSLYEVGRDLLAGLPGAVAIFNPNGEALRGGESIAGLLRRGEEHGVPPYPLWSNIRTLQVEGGWILCDSVGNAQIDLPDVEVCCPASQADASDPAGAVLAATQYMIHKGDVFSDGDTADFSTTETWRAVRFEKTVTAPPRPVICFFPDGSTPPFFLIDRPRERSRPHGDAATPESARREELRELASKRASGRTKLVRAAVAEREADNPLPRSDPRHLTNEVEIGKKNMAFRTNKTQVLREAEVLQGARLAGADRYSLERMPPAGPGDRYYVRCLRCRCMIPVKATVALRCDCGDVSVTPDAAGARWTAPAEAYDVVEPNGLGSIRAHGGPPPSPPSPPSPAPSPPRPAAIPRAERPWWKFWR